MFLFKAGCTDPGFIPRARPDEAHYNQTLGETGKEIILVINNNSYYLCSFCIVYLLLLLFVLVLTYLSYKVHVLLSFFTKPFSYSAYMTWCNYLVASFVCM